MVQQVQSSEAQYQQMERVCGGLQYLKYECWTKWALNSNYSMNIWVVSKNEFIGLNGVGVSPQNTKI